MMLIVDVDDDLDDDFDDDLDDKNDLIVYYFSLNNQTNLKFS